MVLPETDLHRIHLWAREQWPEHMWDEVKVEADVADRYVDLVEVRPPWDDVGEPTRDSVARLRYTQSTGLWAIYWCDRNLKFHQYEQASNQKRSSIARLDRRRRRPDLLGLRCSE